MTTTYTTLSLAAAAVLALAACDAKQDDRTAGQKLDQAIAQAKDAGGKAKENAERGLDRAAEVTKEKSAQVAQKTEELSEKAQAKAAEASERAGAAADRAGERMARAGEKAGQAGERAGDTASAKASDASITAQVKADLAKDPDLSALRIDVDTSQGRVSLSGTAPSEAAKQRAQAIAQATRGVSTVDNRLVVASR